MENMYDPDAEHYLEPREASGDADMFGFYIYNNISIAFRTFAGGVLAGIGSLFFLALNGVSFGVVAGHLVNAGFQDSFFPFVIAHGSFELTAIVISAQAGLLLGWSAFVTRGLSRSESFRRAAKPALTLIGGAAVMLVAAAVLEAFWSSRHEFPLNLRYASGAACWLFVAAYLAEAVRGGLASVPRGQFEAAQALGLSYWRTMGLVVLPQALRIAIPPIVNSFISLFKDTSLVVIIAIFDFAYAVKKSVETDFAWKKYFVEALLFSILVYWVFCFAMSRYSQWLERRAAPLPGGRR